MSDAKVSPCYYSGCDFIVKIEINRNILPLNLRYSTMITRLIGAVCPVEGLKQEQVIPTQAVYVCFAFVCFFLCFALVLFVVLFRF